MCNADVLDLYDRGPNSRDHSRNDKVHSRRGLVSFRLQSGAFPLRGLLGRATNLFCVLCPLCHLVQHLRAESPQSRPANFGHCHLRDCFRAVSGYVDLTHSGEGQRCGSFELQSVYPTTIDVRFDHVDGDASRNLAISAAIKGAHAATAPAMAPASRSGSAPTPTPARTRCRRAEGAAKRRHWAECFGGGMTGRSCGGSQDSPHTYLARARQPLTRSLRRRGRRSCPEGPAERCPTQRALQEVTSR